MNLSIDSLIRSAIEGYGLQNNYGFTVLEGKTQPMLLYRKYVPSPSVEESSYLKKTLS